MHLVPLFRCDITQLSWYLIWKSKKKNITMNIERLMLLLVVISFIHSFIHSTMIDWFIDSFIHSFICRFIHSFICWCCSIVYVDSCSSLHWYSSNNSMLLLPCQTMPWQVLSTVTCWHFVHVLPSNKLLLTCNSELFFWCMISQPAESSNMSGQVCKYVMSKYVMSMSSADVTGQKVNMCRWKYLV